MALRSQRLILFLGQRNSELYLCSLVVFLKTREVSIMLDRLTFLNEMAG
jgi:hypothetical protein